MYTYFLTDFLLILLYIPFHYPGPTDSHVLSKGPTKIHISVFIMSH